MTEPSPRKRLRVLLVALALIGLCAAGIAYRLRVVVEYRNFAGDGWQYYHLAQNLVGPDGVRLLIEEGRDGAEHPRPSVTSAERAAADAVLPDDDATAATWSVAVMELGALVCTASAPRCDACPVADRCAWVTAGRPAYDGPPRPVQRFAGTDRQVRGRLLSVLREAHEPVARAALEAVWDDAVQRERALDGLVADGLVDPLPDSRYALPG